MFDIISGNPTHVYIENVRDPSVYKWQEKVRAVMKDGTVSKIGYDDGYGNVAIDRPHPGKKEYFVNPAYDDGRVISDFVYQLLLSQMEKSCRKNLFEMLKKFDELNPNRGPISRFYYHQDIYIDGGKHDDNNDYNTSYTSDSDNWVFIDPSTQKGRRNYERINGLVNRFLDYFDCRKPLSVSKKKTKSKRKSNMKSKTKRMKSKTKRKSNIKSKTKRKKSSSKKSRRKK